jgi:nucleotidyltransferase substrate binding protein (TIGR01987 family)
MALDFGSLERALAQLEKSLAYVASPLAQQDPALREQFRAAAIQAFEYTYELAWKMLKRRLEQDAATPAEVDRLSFRELIRAGAERGFVSDPERWFEYRDKRNLTAHTYSDATAETVLASATMFAPDAAALLERLRWRAR